MKKVLHFLFRTTIVFLGILTLIFIYLALFEKEIILAFFNWFKNIIASLGYWNFFIIAVFGFIESFPLIGIYVPGQTVLLIVTGFLGYSNMYLAIICAALGALLGNFLGYLLGLKYGDIFLKKYGKRIGVTKTDVKYIKQGIDRYGWLLVVFGKFYNMFRAFVPFIAGSSKMGNKKFTILNIIGSILRAVVMVYLGVFFVNNAEKILENIGKILLVLVLLLIIYIYFFQKEQFMKYLEEKQKDLQ